jgi:SAM-dependent methyltransferase
MSLVDEYRNQLRWRAWDAIFGALPDFDGQVVLDLGCAIGDQAARLAARGARVYGFDANESLLEVARSRAIPRASFVLCDLRQGLPALEPADGIWCSFAAAYFADLGARLADWSRSLRPGAWLAFTDIDDLFGHGPISERARQNFDRFVEEAFAAGRYDFRMGRKLEGHLSRAGFDVVRTFTVPDAELSFDGPAPPDVLEAWRNRFERMPHLRGVIGEKYEATRDEFLSALSHPSHRSVARVCCAIARR